MAELKNILVTGGCGFIGSNFVHYVYKKYPDYRIYVLDALTYAGNLENLEDIEKLELNVSEEASRYVFVKGDVSDEELLESLFEKHKFAHVFHFAAESHVDRSFFNFSNFVRTNVEGALLLALMIKRFGGEMVHVSTDEVYGSIPEALGFVKEDAPFFPANPYASSKAAADMLLQTMMKTSTVPVKIVRGTNNFGPYQYPEKLIPLAITNLLEEKKMPLHGSGAHLRQWIHVDDMCSGIDLVAHKGEKNGIYNIAGEHESNIVVLKKVAEILGKDINQYLERVPDRPNADMRYAIDASKLEALGWKRTHTFVEELPRVVQWYADNKEWWQKLKRKKEFAMHYELQAKAKYF
jgi:dTDP-glucose 4,6-dehydratase